VEAIETPVLTFAVHEDGMLELTSIWFPIVAFPQTVLHSVDGRRLVLRGSELEIICTNGRGHYRLGEPDADGTRVGRLVFSRC